MGRMNPTQAHHVAYSTGAPPRSGVTRYIVVVHHANEMAVATKVAPRTSVTGTSATNGKATFAAMLDTKTAA